MVLHAHKLGPPVLLRDELHASKLHCPHAARANVAHLSALDEVVQRLHCLLDRHGVVEAVDLQQVNVRGVEAGERGVDSIEDGGAAKADMVRVVFELREFVCVFDTSQTGVFADGAEAFCEDGELVARDGELFDCSANDLFGDAVGVDVGLIVSVENNRGLQGWHTGVPRRKSAVPSSFQEREGFLFFNNPGLPFA